MTDTSKSLMSCQNHKKEVAGMDMRQLAKEIVNLHYESHAELYGELRNLYYEAAEKDEDEGKVTIAGLLFDMSLGVNRLRPIVDMLWKVSKPFMESKSTQP